MYINAFKQHQSYTSAWERLWQKKWTILTYITCYYSAVPVYPPCSALLASAFNSFSHNPVGSHKPLSSNKLVVHPGNISFPDSHPNQSQKTTLDETGDWAWDLSPGIWCSTILSSVQATGLRHNSMQVLEKIRALPVLWSRTYSPSNRCPNQRHFIPLASGTGPQNTPNSHPEYQKESTSLWGNCKKPYVLY